jgi:hypothetical protein
MTVLSKRYAHDQRDPSHRSRRHVPPGAVEYGRTRECHHVYAALRLLGKTREPRQTLRDGVISFNAQGPNDLMSIPTPGMPPKLDEEHRAFLVRKDTRTLSCLKNQQMRGVITA